MISLRARARRHVDQLGSTRATVVDIGPLRGIRFEAPPGYRIPAHTHAAPHYTLVLEGSMSERDGAGLRGIDAGEGRVSPPGDSHEIVAGPRGFSCLILHASPGWLEAAGVMPLLQRRWVAGPGLSPLGRRFVAEASRPSLDDVSPLQLESVALELIRGRHLEAGSSSPPSWLERVRERVEDDAANAPTLADLARDAGVSRAHVARAFRQHFGCTVGDHLRTVRLDIARALILTTDLPLSSVAYRAGFSDQSHMTRALRTRLGITPAILRGSESARR